MKYPKIIEDRIVYSNPYHKIRLEKLHLESNDLIDYYILERQDAVAAITLIDKNNLLFVKQYRHPIRQLIIDLPGGYIDAHETPEIAIQRELLEETGYIANKINFLFSFYVDPSISKQKIHIFIASDLIKKSKIKNETISKLSIIKFSNSKIKEIIFNKKIILSSWTYIGISHYLLYLEKVYNDNKCH